MLLLHTVDDFPPSPKLPESKSCHSLTDSDHRVSPIIPVVPSFFFGEDKTSLCGSGLLAGGSDGLDGAVGGVSGVTAELF